ncbi:unnamed protein product, partial [Ectocarpus sp. 13 AM-2016]
MGAMGISANPGVCHLLLATACKAGRGHSARVPGILRAMGDCGLRPDMGLLDALEMLLDAGSPEVALDLLVEVANIGREKKGIGKFWRFDTNVSAAEAYSFVLKWAEKAGRPDIVGSSIHAILRDLPQSLYYNRGSEVEEVSAATAAAAPVSATGGKGDADTPAAGAASCATAASDAVEGLPPTGVRAGDDDPDPLTNDDE